MGETGMKLEVTVCDVCRDPSRTTARYTVSDDQRSVQVDLCEEHAEPLRALPWPYAPTPRKTAARKAAKKTVGPRKTKIMTIEEIEAAKHKRS